LKELTQDMGSAMQTLRQKTALRLANRERPASMPRAKRPDLFGSLGTARAFVARRCGHALKSVRSAIRERLGM